MTMQSTMMNTPLGVVTLHRFGARHFPSSRVGDYDGERIHWRSYADIHADSQRLAAGLTQLGLERGDRVGTFMWNSSHTWRPTWLHLLWVAYCTQLIAASLPITWLTSSIMPTIVFC